MKTLAIEIKSCRDCPFWKEGPRESTDGFDSGHDWFCTKGKKDKRIAGFVEWHKVDKIEIPDWCPL